MFGNSVVAALSGCYHFIKRYSVCFDINVPVFTQWYKDIIFDKDPNEYFKPKNSIGLGLSIGYHF